MQMGHHDVAHILRLVAETGHLPRRAEFRIHADTKIGDEEMHQDEGWAWSCIPRPLSNRTGPSSVSTGRQVPPRCQRGHQGDIEAQLRIWMGIGIFNHR